MVLIPTVITLNEGRWKQSVFVNLRTKKKEQNKNNTKMIDPFHGRTLEEGITNPRPCNMIDIPPRSDSNEVFSQLLIYNIASLSLCIVAYFKYEVL
jgi:hypothetical protein